ncbi:MAG: Asp23/Gls24 family envelope stress response protein [Clostridiales bacterium]|nr:Asp23/Gls24 family envelope stress response protein [Clostridiales bacterium]
MSENKGIISTSEAGGTIAYSEDVIAIISGLAASEVKGVAGMSGGLKSGIGELLGRKDLAKGIKANINNNDVVIDVNIIVQYGTIISDIAQEIQKSVKRAVEGMTGLKVVGVNVNIQGVQVLTEEKK